MRFLKILIVFIFLFAILSSVFVIYLAKLKGQSFFGKIAREELIRHTFILSYANFNAPGDMKFLYLNPKTNSLEVDLRFNNDFAPDEDVEVWIKNMVKETTGKIAVINRFDNLDIAQNSLSDYELTNLEKEINKSHAIKLNIIYVPSYKEKESLAGIVLSRDTIFIFRKAIDTLSEDKKTLKRLEKSTIMH